MTSIYKVLVIEDEIPLLEAIKTKLTQSGFSVLTAQSTDQAFRILENESVDIFWLDHYLLGKENGLDFVAKIKAEDSKYKNIPIVLVSNTASPDKIQSYLRLGIEKYFTKSNVALEQVVEEMKKMMHNIE